MKEQPARALEAAGATSVTFEFRATNVTIPLAIEDWPLRELRANKPSLALRALLAGQKPPMKTRGDVVELSHRMADACGILPLPEVESEAGTMFGAVPTLLYVVDNHGDDIEADLRRFFNCDYRLPRSAGGPSLRQVWVYVRRIPRESALLAARNEGDAPWSRGDILLARQWELWTRKRYPGRPITREEVEAWLADKQSKQADMDDLKQRELRYHPDRANQPPKPPQPPRGNPVESALAVAMRNARRAPKRGTTDGRINNPPGRIPYDPRASGSGW